ncbi:MAG TPA: magnesium transporter [Sedimentisphaerales bacterium]|nr:magnesium transporter [Sedimentisphaerales bacterium]
MLDEQKQLLDQIIFCFETDDRTALGRLLNEQRSSDIAEIVQLLDNEQRRIIFDLLQKPVSAEVLEKVDEATRAELFELLRQDEINSLFSELDLDDAADLLAELPEQARQKVLRSLTPDDSAQIMKLMTYSEDSAGGIMDPVLISVPQDATVAEAINRIRAAEIDEDFYSIYVVDKTGRFVGDVRIRYLLTSPEETLMIDLIDPDAIYITADADQEVVRNIFSKNDLIVAPVLDRNHKLIGRITADRIIEVAQEEAAEDIYAMAGTDPDELEDVSVLHAARVRMTWLLPCLLGTSITALVLMLFKSHYRIVFVAAAAFAPMIGAISGNAGLQTSAIVVSGLATGHLAALRLTQVFTREVRIALIVAISCGIVGGLICAFLPQLLAGPGEIQTDLVKHSRVVFAFGIGMFSAIMVSTTLGLFLPFLFRRIGIDPAISSGPLVTTANDSISVAIYMTLTLLLAG